MLMHDAYALMLTHAYGLWFLPNACLCHMAYSLCLFCLMRNPMPKHMHGFGK